MDLVDTHCHIQSIAEDSKDRTSRLWSKSNSTLNEVIARAHKDGVNTLIVVGCSLQDSINAIDLSLSKSNIYASVGIHPHEANDFLKIKNSKNLFEELLKKDKVVAIGECGLDYYYNYSDHSAQKEVLKFQLDMSLKYNLPLIFHVRNAFDDFWPIIEPYKTKIRAILHSFTDNQANLEKALAQNFLIGINGIATFTKDQNQTQLFKCIPINRIVLETDSPYLTPNPFRGSINEPKNIRIIADYLAELRGEDLVEIAFKTTKNARQFFGV